MTTSAHEREHLPFEEEADVLSDGPEDEDREFLRPTLRGMCEGRGVPGVPLPMVSNGLEMSHEWNRVMEALGKAQGEMSSGPKKTSENPFFHSRYADLSEVISTVRSALLKHGLVVTSGSRTDTYPNITRVMVTTMVCHPESHQWVRTTISFNFHHQTTGKIIDLTPQDVGKAITYGRRYNYLALVDLAPEDDDGNAVSLPRRGADPRRTPPKKKAPAKKLMDGEVPMAVVGHANMKGKPVSELEAEDLIWLLKFLGRGAADESNEWQDKNKTDVVKIAEYVRDHEDDCDVTKEVADLVARVLKKWGE
ncbi:MAG: ERF family protein [Gemmatimonadota bacterium]|nr:MAG: ERF family protein [Gemmatimonadota bacterium]